MREPFVVPKVGGEFDQELRREARVILVDFDESKRGQVASVWLGVEWDERWSEEAVGTDGEWGVWCEYRGKQKNVGGLLEFCGPLARVTGISDIDLLEELRSIEQNGCRVLSEGTFAEIARSVSMRDKIEEDYEVLRSVALTASRWVQSPGKRTLQQLLDRETISDPADGRGFAALMSCRTDLFDELTQLIEERRTVVLATGIQEGSYGAEFLDGFKQHVAQARSTRGGDTGQITVSFDTAVFQDFMVRMLDTQRIVDGHWRMRFTTFLAAIVFCMAESVKGEINKCKPSLNALHRSQFAGCPRGIDTTAWPIAIEIMDCMLDDSKESRERILGTYIKYSRTAGEIGQLMMMFFFMTEAILELLAELLGAESSAVVLLPFSRMHECLHVHHKNYDAEICMDFWLALERWGRESLPVPAELTARARFIICAQELSIANKHAGDACKHHYLRLPPCSLEDTRRFLDLWSGLESVENRAVSVFFTATGGCPIFTLLVLECLDSVLKVDERVTSDNVTPQVARAALVAVRFRNDNEQTSLVTEAVELAKAVVDEIGQIAQKSAALGGTTRASSVLPRLHAYRTRMKKTLVDGDIIHGDSGFGEVWHSGGPFELREANWFAAFAWLNSSLAWIGETGCAQTLEALSSFPDVTIGKAGELPYRLSRLVLDDISAKS